MQIRNILTHEWCLTLYNTLLQPFFISTINLILNKRNWGPQMAICPQLHIKSKIKICSQLAVFACWTRCGLPLL